MTQSYPSLPLRRSRVSHGNSSHDGAGDLPISLNRQSYSSSAHSMCIWEVHGNASYRSCPVYCVTGFTQCPTFPHAVFWRTSILGRGRNSVLSTHFHLPPTATCRYNTVSFSDCGPLEYITVFPDGVAVRQIERKIRE
jgi:hypothetical protein